MYSILGKFMVYITLLSFSRCSHVQHHFSQTEIIVIIFRVEEKNERVKEI